MLATSLSLVVIFVPVAFMGGIVGRFFRSFGLTVAFAVLMSLFVSFTLTPMLCATSSSSIPKRQGRGSRNRAGFYRLIDGDLRTAARLVAPASLGRLVVVCLLVVASTVPLAMSLGANLVPRDDQSEFQVSIRTPEGYTLERTDGVVREIEERLAAVAGRSCSGSPRSARRRAAARGT